MNARRILVGFIFWCAAAGGLLFPLPLGAYVMDLRSPNLEPLRGGRPRDPILVPEGADHLISSGCVVTASVHGIPKDELAFVTDGDGELPDGCWHEPTMYDGRLVLTGGVTWVQIDLGCSQPVYGICVWRYQVPSNITRDMVVQLSNDPTFQQDVHMIFNNDHDNSAGLGKGRDKEYIETNEDRPIAAGGIVARYVRVYANGRYEGKPNPELAKLRNSWERYFFPKVIYSEIAVFGGYPTSEKMHPLKIRLPEPTFM